MISILNYVSINTYNVCWFYLWSREDLVTGCECVIVELRISNVVSFSPASATCSSPLVYKQSAQVSTCENLCQPKN